jgi:hypothetical protein
MSYITSELKCGINRKDRRDRNVPPIGDRPDIMEFHKLIG